MFRYGVASAASRAWVWRVHNASSTTCSLESTTYRRMRAEMSSNTSAPFGSGFGFHSGASCPSFSISAAVCPSSSQSDTSGPCFSGDRDAMLDEAIVSAPIETYEGHAFLHLVARPVVPDEDLLDRAKGDQHIADFLYGLFAAAVSDDVFPRGYGPDLSLSKDYERRADGRASSQGLREEWRESRGSKDVLDIEIG
jgi:hypothetical protein